jgi:hypothetical protein
MLEVPTYRQSCPQEMVLPYFLAGLGIGLVLGWLCACYVFYAWRKYVVKGGGDRQHARSKQGHLSVVCPREEAPGLGEPTSPMTPTAASPPLG